MTYENFSRALREKYSTRLHVVDRLIDQIKQRKLPTKTVHDNVLNKRNLLKTQKNMSFPLISYLNNFEGDQLKTNENKRTGEPYLDECILAAERMKNNRKSEKDRKICFENLILAEKLEKIKNPSGQYLKKDCRNYGEVLNLKANCEHETTKFMNNRDTEKQWISTNKKNSNQENLSDTVVNSYHSLSPVQSGSRTSVTEHEDDQATAADVDVSMNNWDSNWTTSYEKPWRKERKHCNFNSTQPVSTSSTKNDRVYQHLNNIDMTMLRDRTRLLTSQTPKHFSICILPRFDSDVTGNSKHHTKISSHERQYAFKKEILYY